MIGIFTTHVSENAPKLVASLLATTFLSEGKLVAEFEKSLATQLGIMNPIAVNSGTSALHLAVLLADVRLGDEVILPAQTFIASGLAIKYAGATPVFADINYQTGNIDPMSIRRNITNKTKAIMAVHWAGLPCDMSEIHDIANEFKIPVIEDAAHALGATYKGQPVGTLSDFTCFSFQAIKHVTTGDGGAIAFRNNAIAYNARCLRWFGIDKSATPLSILGERVYNVDEIGYKYHLNDYSAALGLANLCEFPKRLQRIRSIAWRYRKEFHNLSGIELWQTPSDRESACWLFGMHVAKREEFIRALHSRGVTASVVHQRIDRNSVFGGVRQDLVNQARFDETQIHIPLHSSLTDEDVEQVISAVKKGW